jgi:4-aminobutyrate aminotransferase-like enzyme
MENEQLYDRSRELGDYLKQSLTAKLKDHPFVGDVRGKGLLLGIELVKDKPTKEPLGADLVNKVIGGCKQKGLIIGKNGATVAGYNNVLTLAPPLNIEMEDLDFIIQTLTEELNGIL